LRLPPTLDCAITFGVRTLPEFILQQKYSPQINWPTYLLTYLQTHSRLVIYECKPSRRHWFTSISVVVSSKRAGMRDGFTTDHCRAVLGIRVLTSIDWLVVTVYTCTSETLLSAITFIIETTYTCSMRQHCSANTVFAVGFLTSCCIVLMSSCHPSACVYVQLWHWQSPWLIEMSLLITSVMSCRLCIELWDSFDACGVTSCGIWAGRRSPIGALQAERSVISKGWRCIATKATSRNESIQLLNFML